MLGNSSDGAPRKAPIGPYDNGILCLGCERKFEAGDAYAARVFLQEFEQFFSPVFDGPNIVAFGSNTVNQTILLRFLVSVLWRASVSTLDFYRHVDLGPFTDAAASMAQDPKSPIGSGTQRFIACTSG